MLLLLNFNHRYIQRESVKAVIHTHSRKLMPFFISSLLPQYNHIPYIHDFLGGCSVVPSALFGTDALVLLFPFILF